MFFIVVSVLFRSSLTALTALKGRVLTIFREGAIADSVGALVGVQVTQGAVCGLVNILVMQDVMPKIHTDKLYKLDHTKQTSVNIGRFTCVRMCPSLRPVLRDEHERPP